MIVNSDLSLHDSTYGFMVSLGWNLLEAQKYKKKKDWANFTEKPERGQHQTSLIKRKPSHMRIWNLQNKITIYDGYYNIDISRCPWNILREKCLHKLQPFILNHRQNDRQYGGRTDQSFQLSILDCLSFLWFICWAMWVVPHFLFFFSRNGSYYLKRHNTS